MSVVFTDIEVAHEFFYLGFKRHSDGLRVGFELSRRTLGWDHARARQVMLANTIVGYNLAGYDLPLIWYAIQMSQDSLPQVEILRRLKATSDAIINGGVRWWEVEKLIQETYPKFRIPQKCDWIDLIEPQPNAFASLKTLNGRLHGRRMQDLPFDPDARMTDAEMDETADYCLTSDLDATENLYVALKEPLELRVALGAEYGEDFRSKSDSQIGEIIVKKRVEQITGARPQKVETRPGTTFRYPVPSFMRFETPELQAILERLRETVFTVRADGKVDLPKWLSETKIKLGSSTYAMGIGGLHSTESNRAVHSDDDYVLVDADVASQYPSIILMLGLYPKAVGKDFLTVYRKIKDDRIAAKRAGNKTRDKGMKIALNGVYGKLGSRYSILYAPHLMVSVTLTGQLTLLMLIERAVAAGIDVVSGNTDGVLFRCPRDDYAGIEKDRLLPSALADVCDEWEQVTGFDLEFAEYRSIYNASVNSYFAIKADGGHKRKGPLANPWNPSKSDFDTRAQLMKNPQATICSDAALALIKDGTPIEETIHNCRDIRQFVTVIKAATGATWRGRYLGKTVRFYWSTDGDDILKAKPHETTGNYAKVPKTDGCAPCMTLPDEFPDDIDYDRYIRETREILMDLGFTERPPDPIKVRLTKANTVPGLLLWALAA